MFFSLNMYIHLYIQLFWWKLSNKVDNFIHADMYPWNILVRSKSSRKGIF
ncbi:hypothetical protein HanPSC8_Chr11g0501301 [Helianthus annuus]|nr:hypothetical protein HanPSC8_Chr11g0501301 [Helianthus annuus]